MKHLSTFVTIGVLLVILAVAPSGCGSSGAISEKRGADSSKSSAAELDSEDLERARAEAKVRLDQANAVLADLQGMGIDTSDLNEYINNEQPLYDNAKTPKEYLGITESAAYWATVVINCCQEKKEAHLAALAEEEEGSEENEEVENEEEGPVDPQPDDDDLVDDEIIVYFYGYASEEEAHSVAEKHGCYFLYIVRAEYDGEFKGDWLTKVRTPEQMDPDEAVELFSGEPLVHKAQRMGPARPTD